jgi:hypothetical protein
MAGLTFDAGVLIEFERGDEVLRRYMRWAVLDGLLLTVPAPALAQVWRGPRSARLSQLLAMTNFEPMDEDLAKAAGVLCGRAGTTDIVDATVVASAARRRDGILTSDPADIRRLAAFAPAVGRVLLLGELRRQ